MGVEEGLAMEEAAMDYLLRTREMALQVWVVDMAWEDMATEVEREPTKKYVHTKQSFKT